MTMEFLKLSKEHFEALKALQRAYKQEIGEDAPLAERNAAADRYRSELSRLITAEDAIADSILGRMKDEKGAVRDLASVRNVWAAGHGVGAGKDDGVDAGTNTDPGVIEGLVGLISTADNLTVFVAVCILLGVSAHREEEACSSKDSEKHFDTFHNKL